MQPYNPYDATSDTLIIAFGILVPIVILIGRYAVRKQRQASLAELRETFQHTTNKDVTLLASFDIVLQKYELDRQSSFWTRVKEGMFYTFTAMLFIVVSVCGLFMLIAHANPGTPDRFRLILAPLQQIPFEGEARYIKQNYELRTMTAISYAFLGSYIWSIHYLIRRVANFDLSPMSFIRLTAHILLAGATAAVLRHCVPAFWGHEHLIVLGAFLVGFFPNAGVDYLMQRFPQLRTKRLARDANDVMRSLPVELVDGIDTQVSFRLAEREILDVENLATANPILLFTETPYSLFQIVDWMAQAQLIVEVGAGKFRQLRDLGLRTIFSIEAAVGLPDLERLASTIMYGEHSEVKLSSGVAAMKASLHVQLMFELYELLQLANRRIGTHPDDVSV